MKGVHQQFANPLEISAASAGYLELGKYFAVYQGYRDVGQAIEKEC